MKNIRVLSLVLLMFFLLSSCSFNESENIETEYREHQEIKSDIITYNDDEMFRISLEEAGLENVLIKKVFSHADLDDSDGYSNVYLLADDRFGERTPCDYYLAIVFDGKVYLKDLAKWENQFSLAATIELHDFDGDGDNEILLQETIDMFGGAGQYLSRVLDFENKEFKEVFSSREGDGTKLNTGFSIKILKNNQFKIKNSFTNYSETFSFQNKTEDYLKYLYDEKGEPIEQTILVDSFFEFAPKDIDDGVYEIVCRQYVSLIGHTDHIGNAKTVLKYNNNTDLFEIIDTEFEIVV